MLTPLSCRSINLAFRKGAIVRHGQIGQTDGYFSRSTVLIIFLLNLFSQCAYFSTVLISLPSLFQCCKFFQRVPKTLQYTVLLNKLLEIALIRYCLDLADQE